MKRLACMALTAMVAAGTAACAAAEDNGSTGGPLRVVAAFYPLAYIAEHIGGADAAVTNLTSPGAEPHDLELRPKQVASIAEADIVVYERGFQPAVDEAVAQNATNEVVDVTRVVPLEDTGTFEGDDPSSHAGHGHESLAGDPHVWLDPLKFARIADAVAEAFVRERPEGAHAFTERLTALETDLSQLDAEFEQGLAHCARRVFVTSHGAFGYLAQRYGLDMVAVSGLDPDAEPSPARLAEVQQVVQETGVTTIFTERLVSPKAAQTLAADLGVTTAVLDPIEGLTQETSDEDYLSLMRANLAELQKANGCS